MKVVVFGANGGTGRRLVELALAKGCDATTAVRDPAKRDMADARVRVVNCDVRDRRTVDAALAEQDVVLCALRSPSRGATDLYSTGAVDKIPPIAC